MRGWQESLDTMRSVAVGFLKIGKSVCEVYSKDDVKTSETVVLKCGSKC